MKLPAVLLLFAAAACINPSARAAEVVAKRASDWETLVKAAAGDGQVTVYGTNGFEPLFDAFQKSFPEIKLNGVIGRGNQLAPKILAERRAGKFLADVYLGGIGTPYSVFYKGAMLDPIEPLFAIGEVTDKSKWFQNRFHYADNDGRYIFIFEFALRADVAYNTQQVRPDEIISYWNFVEPKWRGKIVAIEPHQTGVATGSSLSFFYYHPELGPEFLRRLFGQMELTFSRDTRQLLDWLAVGKFALGLFATDADVAMRQGLPIGRFAPAGFKEGAYGRPQRGTVSLFNRAPHPQAAKLFVNWLLSREGQNIFQKAFADDYSLSVREDLSKDHIPAAYRLGRGEKFFPAYRPEYIDTRAALKVID
jgi:ABC-type Fe3+ transport system substrate-binding protein